jgi:hypothetical protein
MTLSCSLPPLSYPRLSLLRLLLSISYIPNLLLRLAARQISFPNFTFVPSSFRTPPPGVQSATHKAQQPTASIPTSILETKHLTSPGSHSAALHVRPQCVSVWLRGILFAAAFTTNTLSICAQQQINPVIPSRREQSSSVISAANMSDPRGETNNLPVQEGVTTQIRGMAVEIRTDIPQAGIADEIYCLR